jgi:hypothetical protein
LREQKVTRIIHRALSIAAGIVSRTGFFALQEGRQTLQVFLNAMRKYLRVKMPRTGRIATGWEFEEKA